MSGQDKEKEMPASTHNYNPSHGDSSSSSLEHHHHPYLPPLASNQIRPSLRPIRDPDPDPSTTEVVRYRECMKNHAVSMGSHVVDGCREFMPSGEDGTVESLRCAACDCHRNFHRKQTQTEPQQPQQHHVSNYFSSYYYANKNNGQHRNIPSPTAPYSLHHQHHRFIPPMMVAMGGGGGDGGGGAVESSCEDLYMFRSNTGGQPSLPKKRFRTKFTEEQKERMMEFAEKLGWKIQKHDEQELRQFCSQVGVKRKVFKVWMHNNKQARKQQQQV